MIVGRRTALRSLCALGLACATLGLPSSAWAGSYLVRAALLVTSAQKDAEALRKRPTDKELARIVHAMAQARVRTAATMDVPKDVALAHPHLGLVLENYERAADAARNGHPERFLVFLAKAREEDLTLRAVLKRLGWELPEV